jgi:hypothetical protein
MHTRTHAHTGGPYYDTNRDFQVALEERIFDADVKVLFFFFALFFFVSCLCFFVYVFFFLCYVYVFLCVPWLPDCARHTKKNQKKKSVTFRLCERAHHFWCGCYNENDDTSWLIIRDLSYGKRDLSYGKRDLSDGKRDLSYGKRDLSFLMWMLWCDWWSNLIDNTLWYDNLIIQFDKTIW